MFVSQMINSRGNLGKNSIHNKEKAIIDNFDDLKLLIELKDKIEEIKKDIDYE